jgi:pimeloyl-ACP methyl ester carboxylesterase
MQKIPVYLMPGLAASPLIFERLQLPPDRFDVHLLEWLIPAESESLAGYAKRMASLVTAENPVLIGVSFGGILVQEVAAHVKAALVIVISSVKSNREFPRRMKIAKTTGAYKILPLKLLLNVEKLAKYSFGEKVNQRLKLYEKYLSVRDLHYLSWSIEQIMLWRRDAPDPSVIHIHGTDDEVFPIKYISGAIPVKGGTHIMIVNRYKWFNDNLPRIITEALQKKASQPQKLTT